MSGSFVEIMIGRGTLANCPAEKASAWRNPVSLAVAGRLGGFAALEDDYLIWTRLPPRGIPDVRVCVLPSIVCRWLGQWRMGLEPGTIRFALEVPGQRLSRRDLIEGVITEVEDACQPCNVA